MAMFTPTGFQPFRKSVYRYWVLDAFHVVGGIATGSNNQFNTIQFNTRVSDVLKRGRPYLILKTNTPMKFLVPNLSNLMTDAK